LSISTDGGSSFSNKNTTDGLANNLTTGVYVDLVGTSYTATSEGLSISTDGGNSFLNKTTSDGLGHDRIHGVFVVPYWY
jgi:hypothetical protein